MRGELEKRYFFGYFTLRIQHGRNMAQSELRHFGRTVQITTRGDLEKQQAGTAPDLEYAFWPCCHDALNCVLEPLTHLRCRESAACVAAVPAGKIQTRIGGWNCVSVGVLIHAFPVLNVIAFLGDSSRPRGLSGYNPRCEQRPF